MHCRAAQGWVELGNAAEAQVELDAITPDNRTRPEVQKVRWRALALGKHWREALDLAESLIKEDAEDSEAWVHRSFALHELKRTQEACEGLLKVVERFPEDAILRYNLGCYECQLGHLDQARQWLEKAFALNGSRQMLVAALEDPDLEPLWGLLRGMT